MLKLVDFWQATYLAEPAPGLLDLLSQSQGRHHFIWGEHSKFT